MVDTETLFAPELLSRLTNPDLLDLARKVCVGKDSQDVRNVLAEMAKRCLEIWKKVDEDKNNWKISLLSREDELFIRKVNDIVYPQMAKNISYNIKLNTGGYENKPGDDTFCELTGEYTKVLVQDFPYYENTHSLTTYMVNRFRGAHQAYNAGKSDLPAHVHEGKNIVAVAIDDLKKVGYDDNKIFPEDVQRQIAKRKILKSGITEDGVKVDIREDDITEAMIDDMVENGNIPKRSTIAKYMNLALTPKVPYSNDLIDKSNEGFYISPEQQYLKEEENKVVLAAVGSLSRIERIVVSLKEGLFTEETGYFNGRLPNAAIGSHIGVLQAQREIEADLMKSEKRRSVVENRKARAIPKKIVPMQELLYKPEKYTEQELAFLSKKECIPAQVIQDIYQSAIRHLRTTALIRGLRRSKYTDRTYGVEKAFTSLNEECDSGLENYFAGDDMIVSKGIYA